MRRQRKAGYPVAGGSLYERVEAEVARQVAERGRFILPEQIREIRLRERAKFRTVVPFYDYTFSAPKTVSVLWASLLAAAAEADAEGREADARRLAEQAEQVRGAVRRANDRMIGVAEREAYPGGLGPRRQPAQRARRFAVVATARPWGRDRGQDRRDQRQSP